MSTGCQKVLASPLPGPHARHHVATTWPAELDVDAAHIMIGDDAITALLETFQGCKRRGEHATLFLETRNGNQVATFRVKAPAKESKPGEVTTPRKKAPSAVRRDQQRLRTFLLKKSLQESLGSPVASSTPASRPGQFSSNQDIDLYGTCIYISSTRWLCYLL